MSNLTYSWLGGFSR